jgi:hypothetical protein
MDQGRFQLAVDGATELANVGGQADTGVINVSPGIHWVSEGGAGATDISQYTVAFGGDCTSNDTSQGLLARPITLATGDQKVCTITNRGFPAVTLQWIDQTGQSPNFRIQIGSASVTSTNGAVMRLSGLGSANYPVSIAPVDGNTNLNSYVFTFGLDCAAASASQATISLSAGQEKTCRILVQTAGVGGCSAGQRPCGYADDGTAVCVLQGASCNALCPVQQGQSGTFCDVDAKGKPICVYGNQKCK